METGRYGIEYEDLRVGMGRTIGRWDSVLVDVATRLHRGDDVGEATRQKIELFRRDTVAGLRYGIVGMRVGGRRLIKCPPHLGYGEKGVPPLIPPNALLFFEVEAVEHLVRGKRSV